MTEIVQAQSTNLAYMDNEEVAQIAQVVQKVAPWARDMKPQEIGLAVRRAMSMGVDPLNHHEVQIWKDYRGTINIQLAYTLAVEWVLKFKGEHTTPQYLRLSNNDLLEAGLRETDVAYRVEFIMVEDLSKATEYAEVFGKEAAVKMFTVTGVGVATNEEWNRKSQKGFDIFAPAGRSKAWKVQKRALTDAYRGKFGTPTRAEIEILRRDFPEAVESEPESARAMLKRDGRRGKNKLFKTERPALVEEAKDALFGTPEPEEQEEDAVTIGRAPQSPAPVIEVEATAQPFTDPVPALQAEADALNAAAKAPPTPQPQAVGVALREEAGWARVDGQWQRVGGATLGNNRLGMQISAIIGAALKGVPGVDAEKPHRVILNWLFKVSSSKALTTEEGRAIVTRWGGGEKGWDPNPFALTECAAIFTAILEEAGQQRYHDRHA